MSHDPAEGLGDPMLAVGPLSHVNAEHWDALTIDSDRPTVVLDEQGRFLYVNECHARTMARQSQAEVIGKHLSDLYSRSIAAERIAVARWVQETGNPAAVVGILRGRPSTAVMRRVNFGPERRVATLVTIQFPAEPMWLTSNRSTHRIVEAHHADMGKLGLLTPRERQVLRLIAAGFSATEIGKKLFRSPRTIEHHRDSMCRKLQLNGRDDLMLLLAPFAAWRNAGYGAAIEQPLGDQAN